MSSILPLYPCVTDEASSCSELLVTVITGKKGLYPKTQLQEWTDL